MHQADCADSTASTAPTGGKFDNVSAKRIGYLAPFPVSELHTPSDDLAVSLDNIATLLVCASEIAGDDADQIEKFGTGLMSAGRLRHLKSVIGIAIDELSRSMAFHKAIETVVDAHIERRAA